MESRGLAHEVENNGEVSEDEAMLRRCLEGERGTARRQSLLKRLWQLAREREQEASQTNQQSCSP